MITSKNQRIKQFWSNLDCLYLVRNVSVRFTIRILGNSIEGNIEFKMVLYSYHQRHYTCHVGSHSYRNTVLLPDTRERAPP